MHGLNDALSAAAALPKNRQLAALGVLAVQTGLQ
jgi:hypothetical protein